MLLSICIPTFNRLDCLDNCLNSILISSIGLKDRFEVCVSDNKSEDNVNSIIDKYKNKLNINININNENKGHGRNFLKAVSMAKGQYVWTLGDDDLLLPHSLEFLFDLLNRNTDVDFFLINSFNLSSDKVFNFPQPFDTKNLPLKMERYSKDTKSRKLEFFDLINPNISFDYLMGMYLLVFKKINWDKNLDVIDEKKINKKEIFSTFENTCGYVKIISKGFANSKAFFCSEPLSVNLSGRREWNSYYEFIEIVRIPEILDVHRSNGLSLMKFLYCKNLALKNFFPNFIKMYLKKETSGFNYISLKSHFLKNLIYPFSYLSILFFLFRKIRKFFL